MFYRRTLRIVSSLASVAALTWVGRGWLHINATTAGLAYLTLVLVIAGAWGFVEAAIAAVAATLAFNFYFLPPLNTFTIADPQNWVALVAFLTAALITGRLSATAKQQAIEADERRGDVERLYTFSRAILLIGEAEPFPRQLVRKLAEVFEIEAVVLHDRRTGDLHRAGPADFEALDEQLREAALTGKGYADPARRRVITAVRLGAETIGSLGLQGPYMPDSVVQGIANLTAIGLERARAQDLTHQVEAARQSERLRTTLIDAMAHALKTPLTSIRAATTSLLDNPDQPPETRAELVNIANEEAARLQILIDDAVELARLDTAQIDVQLEESAPEELARSVVAAMAPEIEDRPVEVVCGQCPAVTVDRRLMKLALRQLLDNALKYSPPATRVTVTVSRRQGAIAFEVTDLGPGIPLAEQSRIFERFYRSPAVSAQAPGTGLGLSIAARIARAHNGELKVTSRPGETTFRLEIPAEPAGGSFERGPNTGD